MFKTAALGAVAADRPLEPLTIERREPGPSDVLIDILYCGICHSDLHQARDEWGGSIFPMVPGHEIVGRVKQVGPRVTQHGVGDLVAVGCMVDACRDCAWCRAGTEQFCVQRPVFTYNSRERGTQTPTQGGYSRQIVVSEAFVLRVSAGLDPAAAAPLLCAGITTYSPLREWGCKAGDKVAVVGLGGLGHMAVKLAASMKAEVTVISTSRAKEADARRLGATGFALSTEPSSLDALARRFDLIIDTLSAQHDVVPYLRALRPRGTMVLVGVPLSALSVPPMALIGGSKRLVGSSIGGTVETQEMLDYCAARGIVSDVEIIRADQVNEAYTRMVKGDVRYRFVIDLATLIED